MDAHDESVDQGSPDYAAGLKDGRTGNIIRYPLTNGLRFRIITVDHQGAVGRDFHPTDEDIGLVVIPVKVDAWYTSDEDESWVVDPCSHKNDLHPSALKFLFSGVANPARLYEYVEWCWTCVTEDGRVLELLGYEVELA